MTDNKNPDLELKRDDSPVELPVVIGRRRRDLNDRDLKRINLGRAYWYANVAGVQDLDARKIVTRFLQRIVKCLDQGSGLIVCGDAGVGKSGVGAVIGKEATRWGYSVYFASHAELQELRFDDRQFDDSNSVMDRVRSVDLLVLDNFNEDFLDDNRFGPMQLGKLLSRRISNRKSTILTTRIRGDVLASDSRIKTTYELMKEAMMGIFVEGADLRDAIGQQVRRSILGDEEKG